MIIIEYGEGGLLPEADYGNVVAAYEEVENGTTGEIEKTEISVEVAVDENGVPL